jgi:hypothetical protein
MSNQWLLSIDMLGPDKPNLLKTGEQAWICGGTNTPWRPVPPTGYDSTSDQRARYDRNSTIALTERTLAPSNKGPSLCVRRMLTTGSADDHRGT